MGLRVEMFGGLRVDIGGESITRFRTRKTGVLLAYLAYHADRSHPRETLADLLWPESRADASRNSLSQALSSLRASLGRTGEAVDERLVTDRTQVQLHSATDVADFEAAIEAQGTPEERSAALSSAVASYKGEFMPGYYDEWILAERGRLRVLFLRANHELVVLRRKAGDLAGATAAASRGVREDPLFEVATRDLMQCLLDSHEPQLALRAYRELETSLAREVGERPSLLTRGLARDIASAAAGTDPLPVPALQAVPPLASQAPSTTFLLIQLGPEGFQAAWPPAIAANAARIKGELGRQSGQLLYEEPLRLVVGFPYPADGLECSLRLREAMRQVSWPDGSPLDLRMVLDTYVAPRGCDGNKEGCERVLRFAAGLGPAEILLAESAVSMMRPALRPGVRPAELARLSGGERLYLLEFDPAFDEVRRLPVAASDAPPAWPGPRLAGAGAGRS